MAFVWVLFLWILFVWILFVWILFVWILFVLILRSLAHAGLKCFIEGHLKDESITLIASSKMYLRRLVRQQHRPGVQDIFAILCEGGEELFGQSAQRRRITGATRNGNTGAVQDYLAYRNARRNLL